MRHHKKSITPDRNPRIEIIDDRDREFFFVDKVAIDDLSLPASVKLVYVVMVRHLDSSRDCPPGIIDIVARQTGLSLRSTQEAIKELVARRMIRIQEAGVPRHYLLDKALWVTGDFPGRPLSATVTFHPEGTPGNQPPITGALLPFCTRREGCHDE